MVVGHILHQPRFFFFFNGKKKQMDFAVGEKVFFLKKSHQSAASWKDDDFLEVRGVWIQRDNRNEVTFCQHDQIVKGFLIECLHFAIFLYETYSLKINYWSREVPPFSRVNTPLQTNTRAPTHPHTCRFKFSSTFSFQKKKILCFLIFQLFIISHCRRFS